MGIGEDVEVVVQQGALNSVVQHVVAVPAVAVTVEYSTVEIRDSAAVQWISSR